VQDLPDTLLKLASWNDLEEEVVTDAQENGDLSDDAAALVGPMHAKITFVFYFQVLGAGGYNGSSSRAVLLRSLDAAFAALTAADVKKFAPALLPCMGEEIVVRAPHGTPAMTVGPITAMLVHSHLLTAMYAHMKVNARGT